MYNTYNKNLRCHFKQNFQSYNKPSRLLNFILIYRTNSDGNIKCNFIFDKAHDSSLGTRIPTFSLRVNREEKESLMAAMLSLFYYTMLIWHESMHSSARDVACLARRLAA